MRHDNVLTILTLGCHSVPEMDWVARKSLEIGGALEEFSVLTDV